MKRELFDVYWKKLFFLVAVICCMTGFRTDAVSAAEDDTAIEVLEDVYIKGFLQADEEQKNLPTALIWKPPVKSSL